MIITTLTVGKPTIMDCPICFQQATKRRERISVCEYGHVWRLDDNQNIVILQDQPNPPPEPELRRKVPAQKVL